MTIFERLNEMRGHGGPARTRGLTDDQITAFASEDPRVEQAVADAHEAFTQLLADEPELLDESDLVGRRIAVRGSSSFWETVENLPQEFREILKTSIPDSKKVELMGEMRAPVVHFAPDSRPAKAYQKLWREIHLKI